ncbi:methyltransferase domain-containing protein [Danxiaibacter flavus]|uniref:Methyltransferase domain-containing protein n=1 Tax=Danxiaibacter flavus TaxID=3049108 RepID=A0ABV3ZEI2_9BACT|nr:methyltransferase domain-containing protein [Chitinophagaceae bacterium DXS]
MELQEAIRLLHQEVYPFNAPETWVDAGCGSGLFTLALASLLPKGSHIYAVDKNKSVLQNIPDSYNNVSIQTKVADFSSEGMPFNNLDGMLMANSLHYIMDKISFIKQTQRSLKQRHSLLIVEYDTDTAVSSWVPYPVSFASLEKLFTKLGYQHIHKITETASRYNRKGIYAAIAF